MYGIEFSPGGNKVFATVKGSPTPSELFEYSIDSAGHPHFKQRIQQPLELGAIQIAPDGQIYMAINGSTTLGTIQAADDTTRLSSVNFSGFTLKSGTTSKLGLPNFIQQIGNGAGGPSLDVSGVCLGTPTKFTGTATDPIDMFQWFFGDGGGDTQASPEHTYATAGTYNVSMHLTNRVDLIQHLLNQQLFSIRRLNQQYQVRVYFVMAQFCLTQIQLILRACFICGQINPRIKHLP